MKNLKGRCIFAQSGGPTAVINAGIAGGIIQALKEENITGVLCANHGIKGVLCEDFFDMEKEDEKDILALKHTPAMAFGSVRYKLKDYTVDDADYKRILEVFRKYDIRYFFYNGGNDSMDTCDKISAYMERANYEVNVVGIPKTIDNDLVLTDHTPGFSSAAKYIATTVSEVALDASIYESPLVIIVEIMGRDAGWLAASASLAEETGYGADLIYLPERAFSDEKFISDVKKAVDKKTHIVVAVSEGIRYKDGRYVGEAGTKADVFGHTSLGGVCGYLKSLVTGAGVKCKAIELNVLQRCAAHIASPLDIEETFLTGKEAVKRAVCGTTDKMIAIERLSGDKYETKFVEVPLQKVANAEKKIPSEWINEEGNGVTEDFKNYLRPLIGGLSDKKDESGLPSYAKLKKVKFKL